MWAFICRQLSNYIWNRNKNSAHLTAVRPFINIRTHTHAHRWLWLWWEAYTPPTRHTERERDGLEHAVHRYSCSVCYIYMLYVAHAYGQYTSTQTMIEHRFVCVCEFIYVYFSMPFDHLYRRHSPHSYRLYKKFRWLNENNSTIVDEMMRKKEQIYSTWYSDCNMEQKRLEKPTACHAAIAYPFIYEKNVYCRHMLAGVDFIPKNWANIRTFCG